ncbi:hypothetical protein [Kitasatospora griseola]|uniref:hypothetical protein n=1 Tax=Kitasatospora griseola TaxID=2064 RepID=UPI001670896E|nr:hypothetical protein [Kitasatospora griseola]GGR08578.1 hypothetical protein GCM10010195_74090 [Kitasatospora griseola]
MGNQGEQVWPTVKHGVAVFGDRHHLGVGQVDGWVAEADEGHSAVNATEVVLDPADGPVVTDDQAQVVPAGPAQRSSRLRLSHLSAGRVSVL